MMISWVFLISLQVISAFNVNTWRSKSYRRDQANIARLEVAIGKNYEPKWKKLKTLSEEEGEENGKSLAAKGLTGTIPVVFKQGEEERTTMALVGQPIKDVASQAGQFIKYGCGKGECGTCEALCNGKWIKPCMAVVPSDLIEGQQYVIQVKEVKNKAKSSGKFYSVRSFFMGFYNNVLGMFAFVKTRRSAKKNYEERMEFEAMILEKARKRREAREREMSRNKD